MRGRVIHFVATALRHDRGVQRREDHRLAVRRNRRRNGEGALPWVMRLSFQGGDTRRGRLMTRPMINGKRWRPMSSYPTPSLGGRMPLRRGVDMPPQLCWWGRPHLTTRCQFLPRGLCLPVRLGTATWERTSRRGGWRPLPQLHGQSGQMLRGLRGLRRGVGFCQGEYVRSRILARVRFGMDPSAWASGALLLALPRVFAHEAISCRRPFPGIFHLPSSSRSPLRAGKFSYA